MNQHRKTGQHGGGGGGGGQTTVVAAAAVLPSFRGGDKTAAAFLYAFLLVIAFFWAVVFFVLVDNGVPGGVAASTYFATAGCWNAFSLSLCSEASIAALCVAFVLFGGMVRMGFEAARLAAATRTRIACNGVDVFLGLAATLWWCTALFIGYAAVGGHAVFAACLFGGALVGELVLQVVLAVHETAGDGDKYDV